MIAKAKEAVPGVEFISGDVSLWHPDKEADLVFANALFQWIPTHPQFLQKILGNLKRDAVLAVQMPDNISEPSHQAMQSVAQSRDWWPRLKKASEARADILAPTAYYNLLRHRCSHLDIWHTLYNHAVSGHEGIVDMLFTTGLKPYLDLLNDTDKINFLDSYRSELQRNYDVAEDGKVLFRFPRLFILAVK